MLSRFQRDFLWMLASKGAIVAGAVLTWGLINRSLGPGERGVLAEIQAWVGLFLVVLGFSLDSAIYHFSNRDAYGDDDRTRFAAVLRICLAAATLAGLALIPLFVLGTGTVSPKARLLWPSAAGLLVFSSAAAYLVVFFQAAGDIRFAARLGMVQAGLTTILVVAGFVLRLLSLGFVVLSLLAVQAAVLALILAKALRTGLLRGRFRKSLARDYLGAGLKQHPATVSAFLISQVSPLIVLAYGGEASAGLYAAAMTLAMSFMIVPSTYQTALFPRVIHHRDEAEITVRSLRLAFYVWGGISLLLIALAKPILLLYAGPAFAGSAGIFQILMLAYGALALSRLISPFLLKKGVFGLVSLTTALAAAAGLSLHFLLVPAFGPRGAAAATAAACFLGFGFNLWILARLTGTRPLLFLRPDFRGEITFVRERLRERFGPRP